MSYFLKRVTFVNTKKMIKNNGATFTPKSLADFLSQKILSYIDIKEVSVLDPACGEGELLLSMGEQLLKQNIAFSLNGYDLNCNFIEIANRRLKNSGATSSNIIKGDFLESITLTQKQLTLDFSGGTNNNPQLVDVVIANPPYVRTQILGTTQAQLLAKKYHLKGRVDLYYPFLIAMTESLKYGGIIGVITSNRYLFTKSGESVRRYLNENYEIIEVIDLGDTKIFDVAVLPAIFIGKRKSTDKKTTINAKFTKIYEELNGYSGLIKPAIDIYEMLQNNISGYYCINEKRYKKTSGSLICKNKNECSWELLSDSETKWINSIDQNASCLIGDIFKVRVGIKTTADKVFIGDNWDELGENKPEADLLRDLISQENIGRWTITEKATLKILYPHYNDKGKKATIDIESFPKTKKYFEKYEVILKNRKYLINAGRKWFEIWVSHHPKFWSLPKLVFPDISPIPRFFFDDKGKLVNGNCYWILAEKKEDVDKLLLIQGVSNSKLMTKYHDLVFNNKLYSGRRRYFTQYVEKYPLPVFDSVIAKEIIELVRLLNSEINTDMINTYENQ